MVFKILLIDISLDICIFLLIEIGRKLTPLFHFSIIIYFLASNILPLHHPWDMAPLIHKNVLNAICDLEVYIFLYRVSVIS